MELKTRIQYLHRIANEAEQLVDDLKDFVFRNGIDDGTRAEITENEAKGLIRLISGKLEGITINGNEDILDDVITIYDNAIKYIDEELERNAQLTDGHLDKFNKETVDSFNNVRKVLEDSKGTMAEPLKTALDELVEEKANGKIDEEYREIKVEEIEIEENSIREEVKDNTDGLNKFELATRNERQNLEAALELSKKYFEIKKEIDEIEKELAAPDLADEDKERLERQKEGKEKELVATFKKMDDKYEKDDEYKQQENESDIDYLHRMESKEGKSADMQVKYMVTLKQADLVTKIEALKGQQVRVYDPVTKQFNDIDIDKYVDVTKSEELNNLSKTIKSDKLANREGIKEQRNRLNELKTQKEKYTQVNNQNLPAKVNRELGFFEKFSKRREYYENKGENRFKAFFKSFFKKEDANVFADEVKKSRVPSNFRKDILVKLEKDLKNGKRKDQAMRDVKADIITDMEKDDPWVK